MDSDSWTSARLSGSSRRYLSRSDLYFGGHEEFDGDDDSRAEFLCPFCAEDYDVVGLCCHIDEEHAVESKSGVCPVCGKRVGMDLVAHLTMQHASFLRIERQRRLRRGAFNSTFSILRRELREGNLQSLFGGSSFIGSSNSVADPLLSSFMYNPNVADESSSQSRPSVEAALPKEIFKEDFLERKPQQSTPLSDKDKVEKTRRFEFVQGLLMSTILDDEI